MLEIVDVVTADGARSDEETGLSGSGRAVEDVDAVGGGEVSRARSEGKWIMNLAKQRNKS